MHALRLFDLKTDLRYAFRTLRRSPFVVVVTVLSLGLGIGAATAVFTIANAILFRPATGLEAPERLVTIYTTDDNGNRHGPMSYPDYRSIKEQIDAFEDVAAYGFDAVILGEKDSRRQALAEVVTGNYFQVLGIKPALGRTFTGEETTIGRAEPLAVISYERWSRDFGWNPDVIGRTIRVNGVTFTVVGVAPEGLSSRLFALKTDLWIPMGVPGAGTRRVPEELGRRDDREFQLMARLPAEGTIAQVQAQLDVLAGRLHQDYPEAWEDDLGEARTFTVLSERASRLNPDARPELIGVTAVLMGAIGLILLIACSNVAGIYLARANRRRSEMAIRVSLGASRRRLVGLLLTESLIPGLLSGLLGIVLAYVAVRTLGSIALPIGVPLRFDIPLDYRVLGFALLLSIATTMLFGLVPALEGSNANPVTSLKGESWGADGRSGRFRFRNFLIIAQVTGTVIFLAGAGLFFRSLQGASRAELGITPDRIALRTRSLRDFAAGPADAARYYRDLIARLQAIPGVEEVHLSRTVELTMLSEMAGAEVAIEGADPTAEDLPRTFYNSVTPGYLEMMGIPLLRGRSIEESDVHGAPLVAVVNETFAGRFWPGENPIGKRFTIRKLHDSPDARARPSLTYEVVGMAPEARYFSLNQKPTPYFWSALYQDESETFAVLLKGTESAEAMLPILRDEILMEEGELSLLAPTTLQRAVDLQLLDLRVTSQALGWGGVLSLFLALIGLYGIVAYAVTQRSQELAIRMAMGAGRVQVLRTVIRDGMRLTFIGLGIGLALVIPLAFASRSTLFGISPLDPAAMGGTVVILLVAALTACLVPALRVVRLQPMDSLRQQ